MISLPITLISRFIFSIAIIGFVINVTSIIWAQQDPLEIAYAGPSTSVHVIQSVKMAFEEVNEQGGIEGRKLVLNQFIEQNDKDRALSNAQVLANGKNLAVIGHNYSSISFPVGKVYAAKGIPAITPTSTSVKVTIDNDWYFRTVFNDRLPARFGALYAKDVFQEDTVSIISDNELFGKFLGDEFLKNTQSMGLQIAYHHVFDYKAPNRKAQFDRIIKDLLQLPKQGIIFLGMYSLDAAQLVMHIRDAGLSNIIMGGDTLVVEAFIGEIRKLAPQQIWSYSRNVYGTSPFIFESASHLAHQYRENYRKKFEPEPDWAAVYAYDAALVIIEAIRRSGIAKAENLSIAEARKKLRDTIASFDSTSNAVMGVTGPNYFDEVGDAPKPVAMGFYRGADFVPALIQFLLIPRPETVVDLKDKIEQGQIVQIDDLYFFKTNVVYSGIQLKKIKHIDYTNKTFQAEFLLWFRSQERMDHNDILFTDLIEMVSFEPIQQESYGLNHYQLFQVNGIFQGRNNNPDKLGRFLFELRFRHARYPREQILFIPDSVGMGTNNPQSLLREVQKKQVLPANQKRTIDSINVYENSVIESSLGSIRTIFPSIEYSEFRYNFRLTRKGVGFIFENQWYLLIFYLVLNTVGTLFGVFLFFRALDFLSKKTKTDFDDKLVAILHVPMYILVFLVGLTIIHQDMVELMSESSNELFAQILEFLIVLTIIIGGFYRIGDLCREYFVKWAESTDTELDDMVAPYVDKVIKGVCLILIFMKAGELFFGLSATAFLGVLGGFSLAAGLLFRDFFSEIIACIHLYLDNPFKEGDKVAIDGGPKGIVLNIGLRSTTLRCLSGQIVQMPNSRVMGTKIENFSRAESLKTVYNIKINRISSDLVQVLVEGFRKILAQNPGVIPESTHVSFAGFDEGGRVIQILFNSSPDWEKTQFIAEQINLQILQLLEKHQVSLMEYEFLYMDPQQGSQAKSMQSTMPLPTAKTSLSS